MNKIIRAEEKAFNLLAENQFSEIVCKEVVTPEIEIALDIPNNFIKAKRFYKTNFKNTGLTCWEPTTHPSARNDAYYRYCIDQIGNKEGLWVEFGVKFGRSTNELVNIKKEKYPDSKNPLYGFDSFIGLPENTMWGKIGRLSTEGKIPDIDGTKFYKGWFKDTIPTFNHNHSESLALLHIDCDIYSSTVDVLEGVKDKIVKGTVILFDDILSYSQIKEKWVGKEHEYKAFMEFVKKYEVKYKWLASVPNASQAACLIEKIK